MRKFFQSSTSAATAGFLSLSVLLTALEVSSAPKDRPNVLGGKHCPDDILENVMASVYNRAGYDTMRTCKNGNSYNRRGIGS